jgi:hypothetical protein
MYSLANDDSKSIVLLVNDYNIEFDVAMHKLSKVLGRDLEGVVLIDATVKEKNLHKPIQGNNFREIICDFKDSKSIVKALQPISNKLLVVNASSERNQPYYKLLIPHIPYVNTPTESSIDWTTLKDKMRILLRSYSETLVPKFVKITHQDVATLDQKISYLQFPVISKPVGLAASILVKKSNSYEELVTDIKESFVNIDATYKRVRGRGAPELLVEEFIDGDMFSSDAYVDDTGSVWVLPFVKVTTAASLGKEGYYSYRIDSDVKLSKKDIELATDCVKKSVYALGLRSSVAHVELFKSGNSWKIIELGPRAGGYRQDMYYETYGIDHALNELKLKIGLMPDISDKILKHSAVFNIYADTEGVITSVQGIEQAKKLSSILWIKQYAEKGDNAVFCGNGGSFIIDGVMSHEDIDVLNNDMIELRKLIKIDVAS